MANGFNQNSLSAWAAELERLRQAIREFQNTIEYQSKMREKGMENFFAFKESVEKGGFISDADQKELNKKHQNYISDQQRKTTAISNAQKGLADALDAQKHAQKIYNQLFAQHTQKLKSLQGQVQAQLQAYNQTQHQQTAAQKKQIQQNARKRRTVAKGLRSKFGSSKIAAAFMKSYIQPNGTMTIAGEKKAEQLRTQNQFISRLVRSLAALPFFNKAGRALQQLGIMTMMSGVSKFRQGNQLLGVGQIALGLGEYLAPALANAFGTVMTNVVAKKIAEAVAIGTMKGNLGGGGLGKVGGFLGKLGPLVAVLAAIGVGVSDLHKKKQGYDLSTPRGKALSQATGVAQGGMIITGIVGTIIAGLTAAAGAAVAPIVLATGAIATVIYVIGKNLDKIANWFTTAKDWITKAIDKINPFGKGGKGTQAPTDYQAGRANPSYMSQSVGTNQLVQAVANKQVGTPSEFQTDRFRIIQYGSSNFETGGYTVLGSQYSKEQLEAMGAAGKGGLETLKGLNLAGTFTNDARVARAGSSAILQAVQAKTGESLLITSAMASKTSTHEKGLKGHEAGQKFDFSAAGLNEQQAKAKAAKLYATGYFSHAEAEYDKKTKQWHIDARISDQAYKTLEGIQKEQQQQKQAALKKTSPRVKEAPGTAKVTDVVNGSLGLRNSLYGPALGIQ